MRGRVLLAESSSSASGPRERCHPAPAVRAVVEVLLGELVAPVADPQVLDGPRQLRRRRSEREDLPEDLELLAGVAVAVDLPRLGLDDDLAPRRGRAQAVSLGDGHRPGDYNERRTAGFGVNGVPAPMGAPPTRRRRERVAGEWNEV